SSGVSATSSAPRFSSRRLSFVVPGMGAIHGFFARTQVSATWAGVAPLRRAHSRTRSTKARFAFSASVRPEVGAVESRVLVHDAGQKAGAERAPGHEADPKLSAGRQ